MHSYCYVPIRPTILIQFKLVNAEAFGRTWQRRIRHLRDIFETRQLAKTLYSRRGLVVVRIDAQQFHVFFVFIYSMKVLHHKYSVHFVRPNVDVAWHAA